MLELKLGNTNRPMGASNRQTIPHLGTQKKPTVIVSFYLFSLPLIIVFFYLSFLLSFTISLTLYGLRTYVGNE